MAPPKKRLGDILLEMGAVDALQLRSALGHHQQWGMPLGQTLVERRICSVEQVLAALARQTGLPVVRLDDHPLERVPIRLVPRHLAERHRMIPLSLEGTRNECLVVAAAAPVALDDLDAVCAAAGKTRIRALLAADDALERAMVRLYGPGEGDAEERGGGVPVHGLPPSGELTFGFGPPAPVGEVVFAPDPGTHADALTFGFGTPYPSGEAVFAPEAGRSADEVAFGFGTPVPPGEAVFAPEAARSVDEVAIGPEPQAPAQVPPASPEAMPFPPGRVLLYGWSLEVTRALATALTESGVEAEAVDEAQLFGAREEDVVISSTLALETLLGPKERLAPRVIICGTPDRSDMAAAKALGARVYLPPPFSVVQLSVAVQRCHEAAVRRRRQRSAPGRSPR